MVEAGGWRTCGQVCTALLGEVLLEADQFGAGSRVARRDGAASAGIAAFKIYVANFEAHRAARVIAKEVVFPKRWDAVNLQVGAKTQAHVFRGEREPFRHRFKAGGRDDGRAASEC